MKKLEFDQKVIVHLGNGKSKKGMAFSVAGYAIKNGYNVVEEVKRCQDRKELMYGILQSGTCICSDPKYYEREAEKWKDAVDVQLNDIILFDNHLFTIKYMGDYSDMVHLIPYVS